MSTQPATEITAAAIAAVFADRDAWLTRTEILHRLGLPCSRFTPESAAVHDLLNGEGFECRRIDQHVWQFRPLPPLGAREIAARLIRARAAEEARDGENTLAAEDLLNGLRDLGDDQHTDEAFAAEAHRVAVLLMDPRWDA